MCVSLTQAVETMLGRALDATEYKMLVHLNDQGMAKINFDTNAGVAVEDTMEELMLAFLANQQRRDMLVHSLNPMAKLVIQMGAACRRGDASQTLERTPEMVEEGDLALFTTDELMLIVDRCHPRLNGAGFRQLLARLDGKDFFLDELTLEHQDDLLAKDFEMLRSAEIVTGTRFHLSRLVPTQDLQNSAALKNKNFNRSVMNLSGTCCRPQSTLAVKKRPVMLVSRSPASCWFHDVALASPLQVSVAVVKMKSLSPSEAISEVKSVRFPGTDCPSPSSPPQSPPLNPIESIPSSCLCPHRRTTPTTSTTTPERTSHCLNPSRKLTSKVWHKLLFKFGSRKPLAACRD